MQLLRSKIEAKSEIQIIFAHGAGAPMDSDWMNLISDQLAQNRIEIVRFEFPYMVERRLNGKKRPPNRAPVLEKTWLDAIENARRPNVPFFLMGKSMGGRIASHILDETDAKGLICLGFPFHGPKKPLGEKHKPLMDVKTPCLVLQGERDPMGNLDTLKKLNFSKSLELTWVPDGDHSLKPRKSSGYTFDQNIAMVCDEILKFIKKVGSKK